MSAVQWTGEQVEALVIHCLDVSDLRGVDTALTVMAVVDPHRCERLMDTMRLGIALAAAGTDETGGDR